jgi:lipoprotein-releasing system ATP-binding protein
VIALSKVYKTYPHNGNLVEVLKGVDISIEPGQSMAVLGASGVGKSTLMHIMGTLEPPTKGSVLFFGQDVYKLEDSALCALRNREIGFVFQFHHLLPELDALENTMMPALIARLKKEEAQKRAAELLGKFGLSHRLKHRIGELSGGEQQRVAIARALIMKPKLLLADEPTGNLDRKTGEEIIHLLAVLNREEGLSLVVATHNHMLAAAMSDQIEIIDGFIHRKG